MYNRIILIDFSWVYNRYYYVASQEYSGVELEKELSRMLHELLERIEILFARTKVFIVLDSATKDTKNFSLNENYKQNRNKEYKKEVYKSFNKIVSDLASTSRENFSFIKAKGYEADQVIAAIATEYSKDYIIIIYSGDKDLLQLTAYDRVYVSSKFRNGDFIVTTYKEIFEKFKNSKGEDFTRISEDVRDLLKYRSLKGDPSDNLKPVFPRIKDKEIVDIIKHYWIKNSEEPLTESKAQDIINNIKENNPGLAMKLQEHIHDWVTNYKIMNLFNVNDDPDFKITKLIFD